MKQGGGRGDVFPPGFLYEILIFEDIVCSFEGLVLLPGFLSHEISAPQWQLEPIQGSSGEKYEYILNQTKLTRDNLVSNKINLPH